MNKTKTKLRRGDRVELIAGRDIGKQGRILVIDRKKNRVIVEGANMIKKHQKARGQEKPGGIMEMEGTMNISNVMYVHKGQKTKLGYKLEETEKDGKKKMKKVRIARSTGEVID